MGLLFAEGARVTKGEKIRVGMNYIVIPHYSKFHVRFLLKNSLSVILIIFL